MTLLEVSLFIVKWYVIISVGGSTLFFSMVWFAERRNERREQQAQKQEVHLRVVK